MSSRMALYHWITSFPLKVDVNCMSYWDLSPDQQSTIFTGVVGDMRLFIHHYSKAIFLHLYIQSLFMMALNDIESILLYINTSKISINVVHVLISYHEDEFTLWEIRSRTDVRLMNTDGNENIQSAVQKQLALLDVNKDGMVLNSSWSDV